MGDTPKHSVSVAGIVVDDQDRVLVIQRRDNGHWEPPGGVLELDETPEDGVRREVLEETGLIAEVTSLSGIYKNMPRGIVSLVFRCSVSDGKVAPTEEAVDVKWASLSEVWKLMDEAYAVRILDAFDPKTNVRVHDGINLISASPGLAGGHSRSG